MGHPVLQLDQLGLQAQQFAEIQFPVHLFGPLVAIDAADFLGQDGVFQLDLVILVEGFHKLGFQPVLWCVGHGLNSGQCRVRLGQERVGFASVSAKTARRKRA